MDSPSSSRPADASSNDWPVAQFMDRWVDVLIGLGLWVAALVLFTIALGNSPLRDWDEGLVAQVAKEIASSPFRENVWLHPTLHGEPYFNKPPLVHWLVAIAYTWGGITEWTARLPGAWATATSVVCLYTLGRELFPQRMVAILATWTYLCLLPVARHGRLAMLDGMVLLASLGLLLCLLRSRRSPHWSLGVGLFLSMLALTKGMIAVPLLVIALLFVSWDAPRLCRSVYWWMGMLVGCIPALLWYLAQWQQYGSVFWDAHIVQQSLNRVSQAVEQHSGPPWYYGLELLKYSWPWLVFLPMGVWHVWRDRALSWAKLIIVWGGGYLTLISVMSTKLPWYIMPLYPAVALSISLELYRLWQTLVILSTGFPSTGLLSTGLPSIGLPLSRVYHRSLVCVFGIIAMVGWIGFGCFSGSVTGFLPERFIPGIVEHLDWSLALPLAALGLTMSVAIVLLNRGDRHFISILLWGFYCCLLLFMSSNHWNWELGEDYAVKPVAAMVQSSLDPEMDPAETVPPASILTSHPVKRPSLDFYSGYNIIPASLRKIEKQWRKTPTLAVLIDEKSLSQLNLKHIKTLGQVDHWYLIRKREK